MRPFGCIHTGKVKCPEVVQTGKQFRRPMTATTLWDVASSRPSCSRGSFSLHTFSCSPGRALPSSSPVTPCGYLTLCSPLGLSQPQLGADSTWQYGPHMWTARMRGLALPSRGATVCFVFVYVGFLSRRPADVVQLERNGGKRGTCHF